MPASKRRLWLDEPVLVEEKLDGANVRLWLDGHGQLRLAGRGKQDAIDRAGQLGRLRAWAAERFPALRDLLENGTTLYGEWLWVQHSLLYDGLPDYFIALDLWSPVSGFATVDDRDARAHAAALVTPPRLLQGVVGEIRELARLTEQSAFRSGPAEGAVLRRDHVDGIFDRCKWLRSEFVRKPDQSWREHRQHNHLLI